MNNLIKYFILIFIYLSCFLLSCKREPEKAYRMIKDTEIKMMKYIDVSIMRYDKDLFNINKGDMKNELKGLQNSYRFFLDADLEDEQNIIQMQSYLNDALIQSLQEDVMKKYPDLTFLELQLTGAFRRIKVLLPDFEIPVVYTYISGGDFEFPVRYADNVLLIALDMYLDSDYSIYQNIWGIPDFISYRMRKESIIIDCVKVIGRAFLEKTQSKQTALLDRMIYEGKILYFADLCLPNIHDSIKISYTTRQINWSEAYQDKVWSFFVEQDLLYSKDIRTNSNFLNDAPFTSTFSRESPPRLGNYIGWQIVRQFMLNNPNVTVEELFELSNSTNILQAARYRP